MINYVKWLLNRRAAERPGVAGKAALAFGIVCVVPGIGMMFAPDGSLLGGVALTAASLAAVAVGTLPAWKRQQQITVAQDDSPFASSGASQDKLSGSDQYGELRTRLKSLGQNRAVIQLNLVKQKMHDFESVLALRFEPGEMTALRYRAAGERVFDGAIRNIESIDAFASSVRKVDETKLLAQLDALMAAGDGNTNAANAIRERINMMTEANGHIAALLDSNEEALTSLTRVTTRLAALVTGTSASPDVGDMASLIEDLDHLAERTERYGSRIKGHKSLLVTPNS